MATEQCRVFKGKPVPHGLRHLKDYELALIDHYLYLLDLPDDHYSDFLAWCVATKYVAPNEMLAMLR